MSSRIVSFKTLTFRGSRNVEPMSRLFLTACLICWLPNRLCAQNTIPIASRTSPASDLRATSTELNQQARRESVSSCFAAACHGSASNDGPAWSRAARTWNESDPHTRAYNTLHNEHSQSILRKLSLGKLNLSDRATYESWLERKCISCHASPHVTDDQRVLGVTCQACHGPASAWDETHYSRDWESQGPSRFRAGGMIDLESLASRAQVCTSCHVGDLSENDRRREVDHDLIAAGHPPLHFEFETYWNRLPPHWDAGLDTRLHGEGASFKRWKIGKLVHATLRVQSLVARSSEAAQSPSSGRPWPELSEYSCYDCHHALAEPSWRRQRKQGAADRFNWDPWTIAALETACDSSAFADLQRAIDNLRTKMEQRRPQAREVERAAREVLPLLKHQTELARLASAPARATLVPKLRSLLETGPARMDWESAMQWQAASRSIASSLQLDACSRELSALESSVLGRGGKGTAHGTDSPIGFSLLNFEKSRASILKIFERDQRP